jgi:hypothetical protein
MRMIRSLAAIGSIEKPLRMPQERFSRGGGYSGIPFLRAARVDAVDHAPEHFDDGEDDVDAATPVGDVPVAVEI